MAPNSGAIFPSLLRPFLSLLCAYMKMLRREDTRRSTQRN